MIERKVMRRLIDFTKAGRIDWQADEDSFHARLGGSNIAISMRTHDWEPYSWSMDITDANGELVDRAWEEGGGPVMELYELVKEFVYRRDDIRSGRARRREEGMRRLKDDLGL
jgi:hypothetical protein